MEGKLSREVVHATGVHEAQGVPDSSGAQNTLFCDWTDAPVGQGGGHDTCRFTVHLNGAELEGQKEGGQHSVKQRKTHRRLYRLLSWNNLVSSKTAALYTKSVTAQLRLHSAALYNSDHLQQVVQEGRLEEIARSHLEKLYLVSQCFPVGQAKSGIQYHKT